MKTARFCALLLAAGMAARADFSCAMDRKSNGSTDSITKLYLKGQKMLTETPFRTTILDFDAKTITTIDRTRKTYSVERFGDAGAPASEAEMKFSFKETGQSKNIDGFDASQATLTIQADMGQALGGIKVQIDLDVWYSAAVPGAKEFVDFHQRNLGHFPWLSMAGGGDSGMGKAMADLQKQMAGLRGVPIRQVIRMHASGGDPRVMDAMAAALNDTTVETSGFSTAPIPDSRFAIPAGYTKADH